MAPRKTKDTPATGRAGAGGGKAATINDIARLAGVSKKTVSRIINRSPLVREDIWRCLAELKRAGQTILVIDKNVDRLLGVADRHSIIERGRIAWRGDSAALGADRALWHRYLGV